MKEGWRIGIDIGGTFTDIVAFHNTSRERRLAKVPTNARDPLRSLLAALKAVELDWQAVSELIHGTTLVANALVEGKTAPVALVTTQGFEDILSIGRASRRYLYDLAQLPRPTPEVPPSRCFGLSERMDPTGNPIQFPDPAAIEKLIADLKRTGVDAIAVSLLHAYANSAHEMLVGEKLRGAFKYISLSDEVSPEAREYERTVTTVLNAGVMPLATDYLSKLSSQVPKSVNLSLFHSAGGMVSVETVRERPLTLAMSGPAAGATASAFAAREVGLDQVIAFDMGGTTTDVSLINNGAMEMVSEKIISGRAVRQPMAAIESIGAGGGSLVKLGVGGLSIGPESAGADPGPAAYDLGGKEPTITDANAILGYLDPERILGGSIRLNLDLAHKALQPIAKKLGMNTTEAALGVFRVANAVMARAVRRVTVERGIDSRQCTLLAFGGAGPMHACGLAEEVGIRRILVPIASGGFSAFGCLAAVPSFTVQRTIRMRSSAWSDERFTAQRSSVREQAEATLLHAGADPASIRIKEVALMHYVGQSAPAEVPYAGSVSPSDLQEAFKQTHIRLYGYATDEPWAIEAIRIQASVPSTEVPMIPAILPVDETPTAPRLIRRTLCHFPGHSAIEISRFDRSSLVPGSIVSGPAILEDEVSTIIVAPNAKAWADRFGHIHIELEPKVA